MATQAFNKEIRRSITASLGRFLAIAAIVALGCGFYAGLRMSGPDMRIAADRFYDGTSLYDIRLVSTLGFDDDQVEIVRSTAGVETAVPSKSTDVMALLDGEQYAIRMSTFNSKAASSSTCADGCTVESSDESYLNRLILAEGRWPTKAGECVLSADRVMVSPVKMGQTVNVLYGSADLSDVLSVERFTVVGLVHSSSYVSAVTQGTTTLGTGAIQQFMYVTDESFTDDCPYSEIYVTVAGARDEFSGSDAYQAVVDRVAQRLTDEADTLASSRLASIKKMAHDELQDSQSEYDDAKSKADKELAEAEEKLNQAQADLISGQSQLADGEYELSQGQAELDRKRQDATNQLAEGRQKLEDTQRQLDEAQAALDEARPQVESWDEQKASLQEQRAQAQAGLEQARSTEQELNGQIANVEGALDALPNPDDIAPPGETDPAKIEEAEQIRAQRQALEGQLAQLQAGLQETQAGITEATNGIAAIDAGIAEGDAKVAEFQQQQQAVAAGYEQLSQGWNEFYRKEKQARNQLNDAQNTIDASAAQLDAARNELAQGHSEYYQGLEEYNTNKEKAHRELGDAAAALAEARADIDSLEAPDIYVLDRTKNYGVQSAQDDSVRIDNIASVFPFIFFLVAALVALTTMTRMVEEERVLIGTFKALGYSKARITSKYLLYAGIASLAGAALGILILSQVLPATIMRAYAIIYNIPTYPLPLPINMPIALLSAGLGAGVTLLATWAAMTATLREQPAALMLPRAPKAGKRILLERIKPVWERLSFSWKVTCRNLFRYKKRLVMTVIGIAGCTALLLTGLGLHDAIWDIIDKHFGATVRYNVVVQLDDDATDEDKVAVADILADDSFEMNATWVANLNKQVGSASHNPLGVTVTVARDPDEFTQLMYMKDRRSQANVDFDETSVVLTEKLARTLGVGVGDTCVVYDQDDIGNAVGEGQSYTVTGVVEYYVGNAVFLGAQAYEQANGAQPAFTSIFAPCTQDLEQRKALSEQLHDIEHVQTVAYVDETIDSYRTMLSSVNMIVVVLVVAAALLAFIVLYNLTNINITERRREIASLKVLGFTPREVDAYIYREIILLTLIGAAIGLLLGVAMEGFVVETAEVDYVMFGREIHLPSYLSAFGLTLVFSAFVMLAMRAKLKHIDMVESLKSIE